jgi:enoyl-CoA hydratase/carnithine racemase
MADVVEISIDKHVARVTLNRPDRLNAVDLDMFAALGDAGARLATERSLRAVVLSGAGDNFCSGIDTELFKAGSDAIGADAMAAGPTSPANFFQRAAYVWREIPVPVICAIQGAAFGAGLQIALAADLRFAAPQSRLSIMEVRWGLIPDLAISTSLRDLVRLDRVKELAWSGRIVHGREALELGLVTALHEAPLEAAVETAREIAARSPDAIAAMKRLFNAAWQLNDADALALEAKLQSALIGSRNQLEAVAANREKRKPVFSN